MGIAVQNQHASFSRDGDADFVGDFQTTGTREMLLMKELLDQLAQLQSEWHGQVFIYLDVVLQDFHPLLRKRCIDGTLQPPMGYPQGQSDSNNNHQQE